MNLENYKTWSHFTSDDFNTLRELNHRCIEELSIKLNKLGVKWWVDFGTSLGLYRDNEILYADSDTDIGMKIDSVTPELIEMLRDNIQKPQKFFWGYNEWVRSFNDDSYHGLKCLRYDLNENGKAVKIHDTKIFCDIFIWYPINEEYYVMPFKNKYNNFLRASNIVIDGGIKILNRANLDLPFLENIEQSLLEKYGIGWCTPDPKFHHDNKKSHNYAHISTKQLEHCEYNYKLKTIKVHQLNGLF